MKTFLTTWLALGVLCGFWFPAHGILIDRGGGLIYDTDLNITWLQDASYARTSGFDADGMMSFDQAVLWTNGLVYGGFDDWRLPTTLQPDPSCDFHSGGLSSGLDCTGSEMGHLYYTELGNTPGGPLTSTGPFRNLQLDFYWSGTESVPSPDSAWAFGFNSGFQGSAEEFLEHFAWAVHDGDVGGGASVPEPATLLLLGSGLIGLVACKKRFRLSIGD